MSDVSKKIADAWNDLNESICVEFGTWLVGWHKEEVRKLFDQWKSGMSRKDAFTDNISEPEEDEPYFGWCDVQGCKNEACCGGTVWRQSGYWRACYKHSQDFRDGKQRPEMKKSAIDREKRRGTDGVLISATTR